MDYKGEIVKLLNGVQDVGQLKLLYRSLKRLTL